ncbi:hypothetical protein R75471_00419 [Paraburkholderia domus]|nr:hypothetical protein R75471_00419 [Paraburkholderia domus]
MATISFWPSQNNEAHCVKDGLPVPALTEVFENARRGNPQDSGKFQKFDHVESAFADLNFCNERLWAPKTRRQFRLTKPARFPSRNEAIKECTVLRSICGFHQG